MHIGFFSDGFTPQLNGVATSLEQLAAAFEGLGHQVSIFVPAMGDYKDQRPSVYRFRSFKAMKDPPLWLASPVSVRAFSQIRRLGLEIIHLHTPFSMQAVAIGVARYTHLPIVSTYHTLLPAYVQTVRILGGYSVPPRWAERYSAWSCNLCDHVVAPSEKIKDLLEGFGVQKPISVIHNGINLERFEQSKHGAFRHRLGLGPTDRILLAVGRLTPEKNPGFLVEALARVLTHCPEVYLVFVGQGPLRSLLEERAQRLGIGARVRCVGAWPHAEMPAVYADADIYVTASRSEAHSVAALEALAAGLPFVVVRDRSLELTVADGQNGFVTQLETETFAARIVQILQQPALASRMGMCSHAVAQRFSVQSQAQALLNLYTEVLKLRHPLAT